jgi:hypothetical protein
VPVHIEEMTSRVNVNDSNALVDPNVVKQLLKLFMKHVNEELDRREQRKDEQELRPGASAREGTLWS